MKKLVSIGLTLLMVVTLCICHAVSQNQPNGTHLFANEFLFWDEIMNAIIKVESNGDPLAISPSGKYIGAMQISKIVVDDCNQFAKMKRMNVRYNYNDRFNVQKSKEMFILIQLRYNKNRDIEHGIKIWNGGCCYNKSSNKVNNYYIKVKNHMVSQ